MNVLWQPFVAAAAVFAIAMVLNAPRRSLPFSALMGGTVWLIFLLIKGQGSVVLATFAAAAVTGLLAQLFARIFKTPATVFLISTIYLFVPGTSIYRAVFGLISGNRNQFLFYANETIMIAGAIATAVFMIDSIFLIASRVNARKDVHHD
ncbi:MAG TPA: threonine/serine exporter [Clostridiaceae bacterium]|nr:threonine/serine exporter [Clostridiaceae bacterium]